jgi:uncharacterized protein Usg
LTVEYGLIYLMVLLRIQDEDGVFEDFVLEAIDLNHCECFFRFWRVFNANCGVMHNQLLDFWLRRLNGEQVTCFYLAISSLRSFLCCLR